MSDILPHEWVEIHAGTRPEAPAVISGDAVLTYDDLNRRASEHAGRLLAAGAGPEAFVPLRATPTFDTVVAMIGTARLGGVIAPYGPHRLEGESPVGPEAYAVVPTSGSTGRPRGVLLTRRNVASAVEASQRRLENDAVDRWLLTLPLFHVGGLSIVWRSLTAGGSIELHPLFEAGAAAMALRNGPVTMASLVPTMLQRILDADPGPYHGLKAVLLGGAPADASLVERALDVGMPVLQTYGMTETCSQIATVEPGAARESLGTTGPPLDGLTVEIVDGEIVVDGPAVSPGYLGRPPREGPYLTGDLGRFDSSGRLIVEGRRDGMIISGGENIHPAAIEAVIEEHAAVTRAVVVGVPDEDWGEAVVAVVEAESSAGGAIRDSIALRLARHEIPKRWIFTDHVALLPNGKPDRRAARTTALETLGISTGNL